MLPDYLQFLAFYLITVALLKIIAAALSNSSPGSALGAGLAWFIPT